MAVRNMKPKRRTWLTVMIASVLLVLSLGGIWLSAAAARVGDGKTLTLPGGGSLTPNVTYATVDGVALKLDITAPPDDGSTQRPIAVYFHGGGWRNGDKSSGTKYLIPLVRAGYIGITVNYRLSRQADFPAQIHDCKAAIRWVRYHARDLGGDPARIAVIGSSAGGHLASLLGTSGSVAELEGTVGDHLEVSSDVQAVVNWFGPADLTLAGNNANDWHRELLVEFLGSDPRDAPEVAIAASPVTYIDASDPPVLIIHGDADDAVHVGQSRAFAALLRDAGVYVEYIEVPGGGHGRFHGTSPDQAELVQHMITFLDAHL